MKSLTLTPQLAAVAERVVWFEVPSQAIADPVRFMAYVMTFGTHADIAVVRQQLSVADLREAIDHAPAGIFDPRSWAYWNLKLGRYPAPAMPDRPLGQSNSARTGA